MFKSKFKKLFVDMFTPLFKKYNSDFHHVIFAKDCPRKNIWRNQHIQKYKGTRTTSDKDKCIGEFFKYSYQTILPELEQTYSTKMVECDTLEGDDCIYIIKDMLTKRYPDQPIVIIGSDHDLMQLLDNYATDVEKQDRIKIVTLKGKSLHEKSCGDSRKDLEIKIIIGDKSDNIPSCFPKCGYKTALKLVNDHELGNGAAVFTKSGMIAKHFTENAKIGMIGVNVPIPVPVAYHSFGGWKRSLFGDHAMHGPEGIRFYTKLKTATVTWSEDNSGPEFTIPVLS